MTCYLHEYGWRCCAQREIYGQDPINLTHLYQPIVGTVAVGFYMTLGYQLPLQQPGSSTLSSHAYLINLLGISYEDLLQARYKLEGVGLIETYEKEDGSLGKYLEYHLLPPLSARKFFQSDVLSITLHHRLGKNEFQRIKQRLLASTPSSDPNSGVNITKSFQEVFDVITPFRKTQQTEVGLESHSLEPLEDLYAEGKMPNWHDDDLSVIKSRLSGSIRPQQWTPELEEALKEIRFLYQLDVWGLFKALQNPYVTRNGKIHLDRLRSYIQSEYRLRYGQLPKIQDKQQAATLENQQPISEQGLSEEQKHFQQLAQMSPLQLLSLYQGGTQIPESEVKLVESLVRDYQLQPGVINVLLDYVLIKCDRKLPKPLVEKIAAHWKRIGIQSVEQAREQAKKQNLPQSKPKTYRRTANNPSSSSKTSLSKSRSSLPKAVAKQMKAPSTSESAKMSEEEMEQKQKQIKAKLKVMNESLHAWMNQQNQT